MIGPSLQSNSLANRFAPMDIQIIEITFFVVFAIAVTVWGISLNMAARIGKKSIEASHSHSSNWRASQNNPFDPETTSWDAQGTENIECESPAVAIQKLAKKAAEGMGNANAANQYRIEKPANNKLCVSSTGPARVNQGMMLYFDEAEFEAASLGNQNIEIQYRFCFTKLAKRTRRISLWIILGLGLPVILIGFSAMWLFVVQSQNQAIRWQVFQSLQVIHVLWPPFLLIGLYRGAIRNAKNTVPNMIRSLTFQ